MQKIIDFITNSRVWKSFFRHGWPDNPLDRSLIMTTNVFFHLHPVKVSRKSLKWTYTFGLGVISAIAFGVLTITGILFSIQRESAVASMTRSCFCRASRNETLS